MTSYRKVRARARGASAVALAVSGICLLPQHVDAQRIRGIDVSEWQGNLSQDTWDGMAAEAPLGFAFIRSSRGGTVGFYNQSDAFNLQRRNTFTQRFDDRYWEQNVERAVNAGLFVGPYHFGRNDVWTNAGGTVKESVAFASAWFNYFDIANDGADEARHFMQQAGAWMKPGYLLPVYDFEAGERQRTAAQHAVYINAFANEILAEKGVRPIVYVNQNYAINEANASSAAAMPNNWVARWPNQANPSAIDIQNIDPPPSPSTANVYGAWYPQGQPYPTPQPWKFWQYASTGRLQAYANGGSNLDFNVAHGDIEFVKEMLIPALWTKNDANSTGLWSDVHNWNTDVDPSGKGPAARLPGAFAGLGIVDTVVLDNPSYSRPIIFDESAGWQEIRKLIVRNETLNITGGRLDVVYEPTPARPIDFGAGVVGTEIDGSVNVSGTGVLSGHTFQVNATRTLNLSGGTMIFDTINLVPHESSPGKIAIGGNVSLYNSSFENGATINSPGTGTPGSVDLLGGVRKVNVAFGFGAFEDGYDVAINVPVNNGGLIKTGDGYLKLGAANALSGGVEVRGGGVILGGGGTLTSNGAITVQPGGWMIIDNSEIVNANRIHNSSPIVMKGGALNMAGPEEGSASESFGAFTADVGASTVWMDGNNPTLVLASFGKNFGGSVNFIGVDATHRVTITSGVPANALINQAAFVDDYDYAVYDGGGYVRAMVAGAGLHDYATAMTSGRHVKLDSTVSAQGSVSIRTLNLAGFDASVVMNPASTLSISNAGVMKSGGGESLIAGALGATIFSAGDYVFNVVDDDDTLNVTVPITGGNVNGFTKTGFGTLVLSAANTYGGTTTINQGTLRVNTTNAIPDTSPVTVTSGASLEIASLSETIGNLKLTDGSVYGIGALTINGSNTSITYNGVDFGSTISTPRVNMGNVAGTTTFNVADGAADDDLTVYSILANGSGGARSVIKTGPGTLHLAANNSFTGTISINEGTLSIASIGDAPTGAQPLGNNASAINLGSATPATLQYSGDEPGWLFRAINIAGPGGGTIRAIDGQLSLFANVDGNGHPITVDTPDFAVVSIDAPISGNGTSLTKTGPGYLLLGSAANSYTGGTFIRGGTLVYSSNGNFGAAGAITIDGGTLLTLTALNPHNRNIILTGLGGTIDTFGNDSSFTGLISGDGQLRKVDTGTLTLVNVNTYTGPTSIDNGTLNVVGSTGPLSNVMVNPGGTLRGSGTVHGPTYLITGGTIDLAEGGAINNTLTANGGDWIGSGNVTGPVNVKTYDARFNVSGILGALGGVNVMSGTLAGTGTINGNVTLSTAGTINLTDTGNIAGTLTVNNGGGQWKGDGAVNGDIIVASDAFGVTGNVQLNPPAFTSATLGGAGSLILNDNTTLWGWGTIDRNVVIGNNVRIAGTPQRGPLTINSTVNWAANDMKIYGGTIITQGDVITGSLEISGTARGTLGGTGTVTIDGGSVTFRGGNFAFISNNNNTFAGTITKPVILTNNGVINANGYVDRDASPDVTYFGSISSTLTVNGAGGAWNGVGTVSDLVHVSAGTFIIGAGSNLTAQANVNVTGNATLASGGSNAIITGSLNYTSSASSTWGGVIAGSGKTLTLNNNAATLVLEGVNTYNGLTTVNNGTLRLTLNNNIPSASSFVTTMTGATGGTVQLSNGISVNRALTIGGAGLNGSSVSAPGSIGALDNLAGNNTWVGAITLNGIGHNAGDPLLNQISSSAGTMIIRGVIQNGSGSSWAKTGDGDLVLRGADANTYTGLTRVFGGRLILEKNGALGAASDPSTSADGNTFQLAGSSSTIAFRAPPSSSGYEYSTKEWINLEGNGAPGFGQLDNLGGDNTFAGHIGLAGPSDVSTIGVTAGSLNLTGGIWTRGPSGARTLNKIGPGTLIVSGNSAGDPTNTTDNGAIAGGTVNVNAGVLETRSPAADVANLPGMTTWNVADGATLRIGNGVLVADNTTVLLGGLLELPAGGATKTLRTTNLTVNGKLDLADHKLIVDYVSPAASPLGSWNSGQYTGLSRSIVDGRNGGAWNGNGIVTSMADAQGPSSFKATVGITEAALALNLQDDQTAMWRGQIVDATTVLVAYAYQGDANLSGAIDGDDFFLIDSGYQAGAHGFGRGDFNYSGNIDADDYFLINANYSRQYTQLAGVSSVPEPGAACAASALAASLLLRRRRVQ